MSQLEEYGDITYLIICFNFKGINVSSVLNLSGPAYRQDHPPSTPILFVLGIVEPARIIGFKEFGRQI